MKQSKINKAYQALRRVSEVPISVNKAYEIYTLMKELETPFNFEAEREKKLIEKYGCTVKPDGMIMFDKKEDASSFQLEISELNDMDVDIKFDPVIIEYGDMSGYAISPSDIFSLESFVEFRK